MCGRPFAKPASSRPSGQSDYRLRIRHENRYTRSIFPYLFGWQFDGTDVRVMFVLSSRLLKTFAVSIYIDLLIYIVHSPHGVASE